MKVSVLPVSWLVPAVWHGSWRADAGAVCAPAASHCLASAQARPEDDDSVFAAIVAHPRLLERPVAHTLT